ncbi:MAG: serine hydrolase domain-containing protein [Novosphingobium sp.]|uniref:serine hydrolase domain-containing protein n=1 Tax=Novosphingobium sp. TaxID=1874826 RepID=UPI0032BCD650
MSQNDFSRRELLRSSAWLGGAALLAGAPAFPAFARNAPGAGAAWPKVTAMINRYVSEAKVAGMTAALGWGDREPSYISAGLEGFDDKDQAGPESLYRAYSQTKPLTGMAAMILIADGKLKLDQPIADFAPEFARMNVAIDPDKGLDARPAETLITVRHLLTHTAGMGYAGIGKNKPIAKELERLGLTPAIITNLPIPGLGGGPATPDPEEFLRRAATVPLCYEPGRIWRYSMSLDVLGIIIQRAAGAKSFGQFVQDRLLGPLGMADSFFQVPATEIDHLTTNYAVSANAKPFPIDQPKTSIYLKPTPFAFGGSGLVTSPADFDRFLSMVVNAGRHRRGRVMSEAAVRLGTSNLLPAGADLSGTWIAGEHFGAGGVVGVGKRAGVYGWSGAAGTIGYCNVKSRLRTGLYVQYMPTDRYPIFDEFNAAVDADTAAKGKRRR